MRLACNFLVMSLSDFGINVMLTSQKKYRKHSLTLKTWCYVFLKCPFHTNCQIIWHKGADWIILISVDLQ